MKLLTRSMIVAVALAGVLAGAATPASAIVGGRDATQSYDGMTAAQIAYWDDVFAKTVATAEWKQELERSQLEQHYLDSKSARGFLDAEYGRIADIMKQISLANAQIIGSCNFVLEPLRPFVSASQMEVVYNGCVGQAVSPACARPQTIGVIGRIAWMTSAFLSRTASASKEIGGSMAVSDSSWNM